MQGWGAIHKPGSSDTSGAPEIHNDLVNIQGGTTTERFHLTSDIHDRVVADYRDAPTLSLSPNNIPGTAELGDTLVYNETVTITIGNADQVKDNVVNIDGTPFSLPIASYIVNDSFELTANGWNNLSSVSITDAYDNSAIDAYVRKLARFAVFYVITDQDLFAMSNVAIVTWIRANAESVNQATTAIGNVGFTSPASGSNIYVFHPASYGTASIASQFAPANPVVTSTHTFDYTNGSVTTLYKGVKMNAIIGNGGSYNAVIS